MRRGSNSFLGKPNKVGERERDRELYDLYGCEWELLKCGSHGYGPIAESIKHIGTFISLYTIIQHHFHKLRKIIYQK